MALKTFTWCVDAGASLDTELRVNKVQFGDGYAQVSSSGINNAVSSGGFSVTDYYPTVDAAYQFLLEHRGVLPFYLTINGIKRAYITNGNISLNHIGGSAWQLTFNVERFYGA